MWGREAIERRVRNEQKADRRKKADRAGARALGMDLEDYQAVQRTRAKRASSWHGQGSDWEDWISEGGSRHAEWRPRKKAGGSGRDKGEGASVRSGGGCERGPQNRTEQAAPSFRQGGGRQRAGVQAASTQAAAGGGAGSRKGRLPVAIREVMCRYGSECKHLATGDCTYSHVREGGQGGYCRWFAGGCCSFGVGCGSQVR